MDENPYASPAVLEAEPRSPAAAPALPSPLRLCGVFAMLYFVQSVCEPAHGFLHQPLRSLLGPDHWGYSLTWIGVFTVWLGAPWWIKPVFGWISDFLPLGQQRRRNFLLLSTAIAAAGFLAAGWSVDIDTPRGTLLLLLLMFPAVAIAFSDVVIDGLMVATGQPRGLTGKLQSAQWGALYATQIAAGFVAGRMTKYNLIREAIFLCGAVAVLGLLLIALQVKDPPQSQAQGNFRDAVRAFLRALASPITLSVGGFLFLWNFNPFSSVIMQHYIVEELQLGHDFFGEMESVGAIGALIGSVTYGLYCRRIPTRMLIHLSIILGMIATLAYWGVAGKTSTMIVHAIALFTYASATMIQLDMAARIVPPAVAGTMFAMLMSISNAGTDLSMAVGGKLFETIKNRAGPHAAFDGLVAIGAGFTACCFLLVPLLMRVWPQPSGDAAA